MTAKHTPTPWAVDLGNTKGHIKSVAVPGSLSTPTVARYDIEILKPEVQQANAAFIVTAVNSHARLSADRERLLGACKAVDRAIELCMEKELRPYKSAWSGLQASVRAAIRAAEEK